MVTYTSDVIKQQKIHNMPPYCSCGVIQVSTSSDVHIPLQTRSFTVYFKPKCLLISSEVHSRTHYVAFWAATSGLLVLQHSVNYLVSSGIWMLGLADTLIPPHEQYGGILCCFCVLLLLKSRQPFTSIVSDWAATKFTSDTPWVLCGLKHFTHPSIGIVASRWWVNFHLSVNYPFKGWKEAKSGNTTNPRSAIYVHVLCQIWSMLSSCWCWLFCFYDSALWWEQMATR